MSQAKTLGLNDVIGPIMIGPSSSHTAGALRIALMAHNLLEAPPKTLRFTLYGSFARTYRGHGTDRALVAGMLGLRPDDLRIRDSFDIARAQGVTFDFVADTKTKPHHPNTVEIWARDVQDNELTVRGESIGGGAARITRVDGVHVEVTGEFNAAIIYQRDVPGVLGFVATTLGRAGVNIGTSNLYRVNKGGVAHNVLEVDSPIPEQVKQVLLADPRIMRIRFIPADIVASNQSRQPPRFSPEEAEKRLRDLDFQDGASILAYAYSHGQNLGQAFLDREELILAVQGLGADAATLYLSRVLQVMRSSAQGPLDHTPQTMGGLIGGEARALVGCYFSPWESCNTPCYNSPTEKSNTTHDVFDNVFGRAATYAMAVLETNASMGRIVAAPTAGSAGVLPGVLLALQDEARFSDTELCGAIANAAAVGYVITRNATVAGAEGGCQAEMGTASAMAASAATQLLGGSPQQCLAAAAIALTNMLGLVCDPVGGLVEEPCQKRNASAASNALTAAQLALAGVHSTAFFDETVDAMSRVGRALPPELRETALGGIATCESCIARCRQGTAPAH